MRGACLFALGALLIAGQASPIIMRHDVPEKRFIEHAARYPAAVRIRLSNGAAGEGTLIAPRWVLTAAHVAAGVRPDDLVVADGKAYPVERMFMHPRFHKMAITDLPYDIALIRLKLAVTGIQPALLFDGREQVGSIVTIAGRGASGTGLTGPIRENGQLRAATNRVDKVEGTYLQFRFDRAGDPAVTEMEGISGPGDSGNAAFQEIDGKLYVIAVGSWQDTRPTKLVQGLYGVIEYYVRVSSYHDWIVRTMRNN